MDAKEDKLIEFINSLKNPSLGGCPKNFSKIQNTRFISYIIDKEKFKGGKK